MISMYQGSVFDCSTWGAAFLQPGRGKLDLFALRTDFYLQDEAHRVRSKSRLESRWTCETCLAKLVGAVSAQQPGLFSPDCITFQVLYSSLMFSRVGRWYPCIKKWFWYQSKAAFIFVFFNLTRLQVGFERTTLCPELKNAFYSYSLQRPKRPLIFEQLNTFEMEKDSFCSPAAEFVFDYSVKSAHAGRLQHRRGLMLRPQPCNQAIQASLWIIYGLVYNRNHVVFHLCPVKAKLFIQGELLSEGPCRESFNPHSSVTGWKIWMQMSEESARPWGRSPLRALEIPCL